MNLLKETIEVLNENGKCFEDIEYAMIQDIKPFFIENFSKELLNVNYDSSYGPQEIDMNLILVGKDFWLERKDYDGQEWWEYKIAPIKPKISKTLKTVKPEFQ